MSNQTQIIHDDQINKYIETRNIMNTKNTNTDYSSAHGDENYHLDTLFQNDDGQNNIEKTVSHVIKDANGNTKYCFENSPPPANRDGDGDEEYYLSSPQHLKRLQGGERNNENFQKKEVENAISEDPLIQDLLHVTQKSSNMIRNRYAVTAMHDAYLNQNHNQEEPIMDTKSVGYSGYNSIIDPKLLQKPLTNTHRGRSNQNYTNNAHTIAISHEMKKNTPLAVVNMKKDQSKLNMIRRVDNHDNHRGNRDSARVSVTSALGKNTRRNPISIVSRTNVDESDLHLQMSSNTLTNINTSQGTTLNKRGYTFNNIARNHMGRNVNNTYMSGDDTVNTFQNSISLNSLKEYNDVKKTQRGKHLKSIEESLLYRNNASDVQTHKSTGVLGSIKNWVTDTLNLKREINILNTNSNITHSQQHINRLGNESQSEYIKTKSGLKNNGLTDLQNGNLQTNYSGSSNLILGKIPISSNHISLNSLKHSFKPSNNSNSLLNEVVHPSNYVTRRQQIAFDNTDGFEENIKTLGINVNQHSDRFGTIDTLKRKEEMRKGTNNKMYEDLNSEFQWRNQVLSTNPIDSNISNSSNNLMSAEVMLVRDDVNNYEVPGDLLMKTSSIEHNMSSANNMNNNNLIFTNTERTKRVDNNMSNSENCVHMTKNINSGVTHGFTMEKSSIVQDTRRHDLKSEELSSQNNIGSTTFIPDSTEKWSQMTYSIPHTKLNTLNESINDDLHFNHVTFRGDVGNRMLPFMKTMKHAY